MPYIEPENRKLWDIWLDESPTLFDKPGYLNYIITRLVLRYLGNSPSYAELNAVIGVLECAKMELYRRKVAPYEDTKREENGDVF